MVRPGNSGTVLHGPSLRMEADGAAGMVPHTCARTTRPLALTLERPVITLQPTRRVPRGSTATSVARAPGDSASSPFSHPQPAPSSLVSPGHPSPIHSHLGSLPVWDPCPIFPLLELEEGSPHTLSPTGPTESLHQIPGRQNRIYPNQGQRPPSLSMYSLVLRF